MAIDKLKGLFKRNMVSTTMNAPTPISNTTEDLSTTYEPMKIGGLKWQKIKMETQMLLRGVGLL